MIPKVFLLLFFVIKVSGQSYDNKVKENYFATNLGGTIDERSQKTDDQRSVPTNLISQLYENIQTKKSQPCRRRFNPDIIKTDVVEHHQFPIFSTQLPAVYGKVEKVNVESLKDAWIARSLKNELPTETKTAENDELESEYRIVPETHNNNNKVGRDCDTEKQKNKLHPIEDEKYDERSEGDQKHNTDVDCDNDNENKNAKDSSSRRFLTGPSKKIDFSKRIKNQPTLQSVSPNAVPLDMKDNSPALLEDPAKSSGVSELFESKMLLSQNSNIVCYACSTLSNPRCWEPDKGTTVKYCRKGHDACVKKSYDIDGTEVVLRDCAMSCTESSAPAFTPKYKTCSICHNDLCNGAFGINSNVILIMLGFFVIAVIVLN